MYVMYRKFNMPGKTPRIFKTNEKEFNSYKKSYPSNTDTDNTDTWKEFVLSDLYRYTQPIGYKIGLHWSFNGWKYGYEKTTYGNLATKLDLNVGTLFENLHFRAS